MVIVKFERRRLQYLGKAGELQGKAAYLLWLFPFPNLKISAVCKCMQRHGSTCKTDGAEGGPEREKERDRERARREKQEKKQRKYGESRERERGRELR